jgi:hypothetical protein
VTAGALSFAWPTGKQAAVSLTYDDGLPVHYNLAGPLLEHHNLRATFYPPIDSDLRRHPDRWRELAAAGHELGNHTIFHPCRQTDPEPYPWLDERYDLAGYTLDQLRTEFEVANLVLHLLDGQIERTYGNTCCDTTVGHGSLETPMEPILGELFLAARGRLTGRIACPASEINLLDIGCIHIDGLSFDDLKGLVETARECCGWAVLMLHGIGPGTHSLYLDEGIHARFIAWLADQQSIWTAPVRTIARYLKEHLNSG